MSRTFEDRPAIRERTPLLIGLVGPSSSGKTYSALRLAGGFQRVTGGETFVIDSEARRSLHYANDFKFRHLAFGAPFSPLDYLQAIEHCVKKGATTIIIDSMSHEHEGPGGVLEMHAAEHARMGGRDGTKMLAWNKPKSERRRLINSILQLSCNFIFCFRAKPKLKIEKGKDPEQLGYQPISGDDFMFEMTLKCLLLPGANGVPTWQSGYSGEKNMMKLPKQFLQLFASGPQLTEDLGEHLAKWAAGDAAAQPARRSIADMLASYTACTDSATFRALEEERGAMWKVVGADDKAKLKAAAKETEDRIKKALAESEAITKQQVETEMVTPTATPDPDADLDTRDRPGDPR